MQRPPRHIRPLAHPVAHPPAASALALTLGPAIARADSIAPPFSYTKPTPNGQYLFVMISPRPLDDETRRWTEQKAAEIRSIRQTYPQSGLYKNDGSTTPLWTVNWYAYDVDLASDGIHLVRRGPWANRASDEACTFFASGKPLQSYQVADLIDLKFILPHSASHFRWASASILDDANRRYTVATKDGNTFLFDLTTGSILSQSRPARIIKWVLWLAIASIAISTVLVIYRKRAHAKPTPKPTP